MTLILVDIRPFAMMEEGIFHESTRQLFPQFDYGNFTGGDCK
jgi:hypothetical protein